MKNIHMNKVTLVCTVCCKRFPCMAYYKRHVDSPCAACDDDRVVSYVPCGGAEKSRNSSDSTSTDVENISFSDVAYIESMNVESYTQDAEDTSSLHLMTKLSSLARHLESKHRCSKAAVDMVVNSVADILATAGCAIDVSAVCNQKARKALYSFQKIYVSPQEIVLASGEKAYFVPLKNLLENLLLHPTLAGFFHSNLKSTECDLLKDFTDGTRFQCHPIATHEKNLIVMLLYCDDIELANPIGMKRGSRGKLTVFYVTFVNIPPFERSKVSNIFLLAVGKSRDLKTPKAKRMLLEDFISTVNDLQKGCKLRSLVGEETFYGFLLAYSGDSLACHNIGGFKESFSKNVRMACRTCTVPTMDFHKLHCEIQCPLRTESQYAEQLLQLERATSRKVQMELSAQYGINSASVLAQLDNFSVLTDLLYDPMHILLEGVVPLEISLFVKFMVRDASWMTLTQLNKAVSNFRFHKLVSKSDYPRPFETDFSFPCSASSSLVLLLHFRFMLCDLIPQHLVREPHCESFLLLCVIVQLLISPVMLPDALADAEVLIARHNEIFVRLYGSDAFRPKLHMLLHIPSQIRRFGPSHHHWTMRFESKNALPKSKKFWNFKNIPLSVADFFQMKMSSDLWEGPQHPKFSGVNEKYRLEGFGTPFCLTPAFLQSGLDLNDLGKVASSVPFAYVFNVKVSVSDVVVFSKNDDVAFGKVQDIVVWKEKLFLIVNIFVKVCFSSSLNAFNLLRTPHTLVINPESLLYPWPLYSYTKNDDFYVITKCLHESPLAEV